MFYKDKASNEKKSCFLKIKFSKVLLCFKDKVSDERF